MRTAVGSSTSDCADSSGSRSLTSYGLFVDVGVTDGLVHRSAITRDKGVEPTSPHPRGKVVKVVVIGVDRDRQRISLSNKRTGAHPWER
jgi:small subunit ribosomal protein S1